MSLLSKDIEQLQAGSGFKFSAVKVDALRSSEYTLVSLVVDVSESVKKFKTALENMLKAVHGACFMSPRKDALLMRITSFSEVLNELIGFQLLANIKDTDMDGILHVGGYTALFDATMEALEVTVSQAENLNKLDYTVNATIYIVTDGENNRGKVRLSEPIKARVEAIRKAECLQNILIVLIGVTDNNVSLSTYLQDFKDGAALDQYIDIGTATPGKLAKLGEFISASVSSASSALAQKQASQPLDPKPYNF